MPIFASFHAVLYSVSPVVSWFQLLFSSGFVLSAASHVLCEGLGYPHAPACRYGGGRPSDATVSTTRQALDGHPEIYDKHRQLWASMLEGVMGLRG